MRSVKSVGTVVGVALSLSAVGVGTASAAARIGHFSFYDCVGPAGTPTSFVALKENLPAAEGGTASAAVAYRLSDGSGVFVVQEFGDSTIGVGIPSSNLTTTCQIDFGQTTFTFTGFIAPRG
jgi:uncharacterized membrane-anchored protein YitT (DUF2179 family)